MKILLTGAAGFTGRFFKDMAVSHGHHVLALGADLTDRAALLDEVMAAAPDAVVHLAGISFVGHADDSAFYAVNTVGTTHLLSALAQLAVPPGKVLLASSANVYGNSDASPLREHQPPAPVNHYAMSKWAMETMGNTFLDRLPIVVARPFNYTGPGQAPEFLIPKLIRHFVQRAPSIDLGNLHVEREYNDVRLVCEAYLALLEHGRAGEVYNVCSGQPHGLQSVIEKLSRLTGHEMRVVVNPAFVRPNEVHSLCGSTEKLLACTGPLKVYTLDETLRWMLGSAEAVGAQPWVGVGL